MDIKSSMLLPVMFVLVLIVQTLAAPALGEETAPDVSVDKRPKYMETRELEDAFKSLILSTIQELVEEGDLSTDIVSNAEPSTQQKTEKRGRQGLCWRRSNGKVRPFFCWRGNESAAKRGQQGLCYRKISQNRVMPYVCWKNNK